MKIINTQHMKITTAMIIGLIPYMGPGGKGIAIPVFRTGDYKRNFCQTLNKDLSKVESFVDVTNEEKLDDMTHIPPSMSRSVSVGDPTVWIVSLGEQGKFQGTLKKLHGVLVGTAEELTPYRSFLLSQSNLFSQIWSSELANIKVVSDSAGGSIVEEGKKK